MKQRYTEVIHVRVTSETLAALEAVTQGQPFDRSDFIRDAIWEALDRQFGADERKREAEARNG